MTLHRNVIEKRLKMVNLFFYYQNKIKNESKHLIALDALQRRIFLIGQQIEYTAKITRFRVLPNHCNLIKVPHLYSFLGKDSKL